MKFKLRGTNILGVELIVSGKAGVEDIRREVTEKKQILKGARLIITLIDTRMEKEELEEVSEAVRGIDGVKFCGFKTNIRENRENCISLGIPCDMVDEGFEKVRESLNVEFIKRTLRSGEKVSSPSDVAILGDVNPGAEVESGGNIYIFGSLRGIAKAGIGKESAEIRAFFAQTPKVEICGVSYPFEKGESFTNFRISFKNGKIHLKGR